MKKEIAVVLVSGGMDSCVTSAIASKKYKLAFLHFNYGQRTEKRELQSFHAIADYYKSKLKLIVSIQHLVNIGGSSLTDKNIKVSKANVHSKKIPSSYVPFRNANFLSVAVSWGEVLGARKIFIGAVEEDSSGYPDCRKEFYDAFNVAIAKGTKPTTKICIETPIIHLKKFEIIKKGIQLNAPLHLTWSCYKNNNIACGICDSCALRLRGFQMAKVDDNIKYKKKPSYL